MLFGFNQNSLFWITHGTKQNYLKDLYFTPLFHSALLIFLKFRISPSNLSLSHFRKSLFFLYFLFYIFYFFFLLPLLVQFTWIPRSFSFASGCQGNGHHGNQGDVQDLVWKSRVAWLYSKTLRDSETSTVRLRSELEVKKV